MKLRFSPTSPYVRKVMVVAHETGLAGRIELVSTNVWDPATDIARDNPLGKVPTLIAEDGTALFDSPVICEYLDTLHKGARLFPDADDGRWAVLRLQALCDGVLDAAILRLLEGKREAAQQSPAWIERQKRVIGRGLDALEADVTALTRMNIGTIAAGVTLGYLDFRFGVDNWRSTRPKLAAWYESFAKRPSMGATAPKDPV